MRDDEREWSQKKRQTLRAWARLQTLQTLTWVGFWLLIAIMLALNWYADGR